jgi:carboxypeptidase PM20D1
MANRSVRRVLGAGALALGVLVAVLLTRTLTVASRQIELPPAPDLPVDARAAAERLAEAVRLETVTHQDRSQDDRAAFEALHALLRRSYPRAHEVLDVETVADLSLLYTWRGTDPQLAPMVLMAHQDVVPIADPEAWSQDPFGGTIDDTFVWGRGTLDDKQSVLGILEAVEILLAKGFAPKRTVLLAFGHDEEVRGAGARAIAALLRERDQTPHLVLDEGSIIADGIVPGLSRPAALIGITEKGYATLELTARSEGGHSSMPPQHTAAGVLARAVTDLEARPFPYSISKPVARQLDYLGPEMAFGLRLAMTNRWLFGRAIVDTMAGTKAGRAQLRTTTAVTMLAGSPKENVLPARATAVVNFRIKPGETVQSVTQHVRAVVGDGVEVTVRPGASDPPPQSSIDGDAFTVLQRSVAEVFPDAVVAPSLVVATTDARAYAGFAPDVYRFLPLTLTKEDLPRIHGVDERVAIAAHARAIRFYARLIENDAAPD